MVNVRKFQLYLWAMCIRFEGLTVPFPPRNVAIEVATHHVIVTWDPPIEPNDEITIYVVSYSILPDLRVTMNYVTDGSRFSLIPVEGREGRLFMIQVQAQNQVGLGNPSAARYARIGCGKTLWLNPSASASLIYPETEGNYNTGVLCQWTLSTEDTCFFWIMFDTLQLMVPDNKPCTEDYVTIGNKGHFCHAQEETKIVTYRDSNATVTFNSDIWAPGKRFHLRIMSIKPPGPPTSIIVESNENNVILKWQPPTLVTTPITSYVVRYSVLPDGPTVIRHLEPNLFYFSIDTKPFEGRIILMNVTARIYDVEGVTSNLLKVRGQCQRNIVLENNGETDIYSPNYPNHYPAGTICTWNIRAKMNVPLTVIFLDFQLEDSYRCRGDYIAISTNPDEKFCGAIQPFWTLETDVAALDVTFISNNEGQKSGFHLQVLARVKPPGPPTSFTVESNENNVILKWQPPTLETTPITSYVVRYSVLPDGPTVIRHLEPNLFYFSIDTKSFEGRIIVMNVTARIYDVEGVTSNLLKVRVQCQRNIVLELNGETDIYSPNYPNHYPASTICTWRFRAKKDVPLSVKFLDFQLEDSYRCRGDYITISTNPDEKLCGAIQPFWTLETDVAALDVTFISNNEGQKSGFHLQVLARVKPPGPPTSFTVESNENNVILKWQPPTLETTPITSYVVRYSVLPDGPTVIRHLEPNLFYFSIVTKSFEGRIIVMNVTARIYDVEGVPSNLLKVRVQCQRNIVLEPNGETDIYSPNYPNHYPAGTICTWKIRAEKDVPLSVKFLDFQLEDSYRCRGDYITISTNPDKTFCGAIQPFWTLETDVAALDVTFISNNEVQNNGFHLQVLARVKPPGPPTSFTVESNENNVILKWQPPTLETTPITSYVVRYLVLPDGPTVIRHLEPNLFYFSIDTKSFEGRIIVMNVTARIYDVEGVPSNLRKVRVQCQRNIVLEPNGETDIYSPNYPNHYPAGTICTWKIRAEKDVPLSVKFLDFQLEDSYRCRGDYITISTNPDETFCGAIQPFWTLETDVAALDVTFISNNEVQNNGFHLQVLARVKPPGPPTSFTVESYENNVILKWQPPTLVTTPITSYVVRYSVLPDGPTVIRHLEPNLFYFSIDTKRFEGKIILMNVTARIYDVEGATANSLNVRAHCLRNIVLEPNTETDIFSFNYPNHYPAGTICTWNIQANRKLTLLVKFVDFRLRDKYPCINDYILVSITPYERFCGIIQPSRTLETHAASLDVTFVSDNEDHEGRFHLQVLAKGTSTSTTVQTQGDQNGLRKNIFTCILNCLYSLIDAIRQSGFLTTVFGGLGTIVATSLNLISSYYKGDNSNFIERVKEYVLERIGISRQNLRIYRVVRSCTECFW